MGLISGLGRRPHLTARHVLGSFKSRCSCGTRTQPPQVFCSNCAPLHSPSISSSQNSADQTTILKMSSSIAVFALLLSMFVAIAAENADLAVLMDLKASLDPTGCSLSSWTIDADPCSGKFEGIACDEHGRVANISLQGKGLSGKISPAVGKLRSLSGLFLHYNRLSGEIPLEIASLVDLTDLYLNVNSLSGELPAEIGNMAGLQVLQLGYNGLSGSIPSQIGRLNRLNVLAIQSNHLAGAIPASIGYLPELTRLDLSGNQLFGSIPSKLALLPRLKSLDLRNNTLSGKVPNGLKRLGGGFHYKNNKGLCGEGFSSLDLCKEEPYASLPRTEIPQSAAIKSNGSNSTTSSYSFSSSPLMIVAIAIGSTIILAILTAFACYRRRKQKIGSSLEVSDGKQSTELIVEAKTPSTAVGRRSWDSSKTSKFNLEEIESATQHFSDANLLGRSCFASTYRGFLRDGSSVAVKRINRSSCRAEEAEFFDSLKLLTSLSHENLVSLNGFCCSTDRGECFLVFDYAPNGNLSQYLETKGKVSNPRVLTWPERVAIVNGVARGLEYLHSKAGMIHQNLSTDKILLGERCKALISGACVQRLLADDVVYSSQKASAAMGYLAPEYATAGRFSEKSDVYAFGVIVLQILTGKSMANPMRPFADPCKLEDLVDPRLELKYPRSEAAKLVAMALACTSEAPSLRPGMAMVVQDLGKLAG
ncbi:LRR receptor kinase BAK1-like [Wolffia australiana]